MLYSDNELVIRPYRRADSDCIAAMINSDPYHLLNGMTSDQFERDLDSPGERMREHTYVGELARTAVGYVTLCIADRGTHFAAASFGTVAAGHRRRGIGSALFRFAFSRLDELAAREGKPVQFKHRAVGRIAGEAGLARLFGMREQGGLDMLRLRLAAGMPFPPGEPARLRVRQAAIGDVSVWTSIYNDAFGGRRSEEDVHYEFEGFVPGRDLYLVGATESGEAVGIVSSKRHGAAARIPALAVRREWQGRGIGKALLAELLHRLERSGVAEARLTVDRDHTAARSLYDKFGFRQEDSRLHYVASFGG